MKPDSSITLGVTGGAGVHASDDAAAERQTRISGVHITEIAPGAGAASAREIWEARELLYFMVWRDLKVRYRQTALGVGWALMQPFFTMVVFSIFFGRFAGIPSDGVPYPVFSFAGLLPWTFFSNALSSAAGSVVGNADLISKAYFPRVIIPAAAVIAAAADLAIASSIQVAMMLYYGVAITPAILMIVPLTALTAATAFAVGLIAAAINVRWRDIRYVLPFALQLWLYATPVIYPIALVPASWRWLVRLNPMSGIIAGWRAALLGRPWDVQGLAIALGVTVAAFPVALRFFRTAERKFADLI